MKFAFDVHLHIVPLQHACLSLVVDFTKTHPKEETLALASAPNYLAKNILAHPDEALNLLNVMERKPSDELAILDDDLRGAYAHKPAEENRLPFGKRAAEKETAALFEPILSDAGIKVTKNLMYDYLVICPQIMDFDSRKSLSIGYADPPHHDIFEQASEILDGIRTFRDSHPSSRFIVRPFLGINPLQYDEEKIAAILDTYFGKKSGWSSKADDALDTWKITGSKYHNTRAAGRTTDDHAPYKNVFAGIKVYPPLGFDPWPDDEEARSKCALMYSFCQEYEVPIVSHCDDQGFRTIPQEESFKYTSPERWSHVLEQYPDLYIDLAHFGMQYYRGLRFRTETTWQTILLTLIKTYPHVYSDFAFNGVDADEWEKVLGILEDAAPKDRAKYESRFMFGTDWPLSLNKIDCALSYWRGFAESGLSDEMKNKMVSENPASFMFR